MRSAILFVVALLAVVGGFAVYWMLQSPESTVAPVAPRSQQRMSAAPTTSPSGGGPFGPGRDAWMDHYNKDGLRTSRLRFKGYRMSEDGRLLVEKPEAEFFMGDGQMIRLLAETGLVVTQEGVSRARNVPPGMEFNKSPRSGDLRNVTLLIYPRPGAARPTLTLTTNNVSFDNETFRIANEAYDDAGGSRIAAENVPVTIRGDEYELDGSGLNLQYNEVAGRIDYLRLEKGRRLLVRNPREYFKTAAKPSRAAARPVAGVMLASADPTHAARAATRSATTRRARPPQPVYRATFTEAVRVFQAGQKLATADQMQIDFLPEDQDMKAVVEGGAATRPSKARTPASAPTEPPIEILWSGPLTVIPQPDPRPARIAPGESILRLVGRAGRIVEVVRALKAQKEGEPPVMATLRCAALTHWTIDGDALLDGTPESPVEMVDTRGTRVLSQTMLFSQKDDRLILTGRGSVRLPADESPGRSQAGPQTRPAAKKGPMLAEWTDGCTLQLDGDDPERMVIREADLRGGVRVTDPELRLSSRHLNLAFEVPIGESKGPATRPARMPRLSRLSADGQVDCEISGPGGDTDVQKIKCDELALATATAPDGALYARRFTASGNVQLKDAQRELTAGRLDSTLRQPTTRPAKAGDAGKGALPGEIEKLIATGGVRVVSDDAFAQGEKITIEIEDGRQTITLAGPNAKIASGEDYLVGPTIRVVPDLEQFEVAGAGRLRAAPKQKDAEPLDVSWTKGLVGSGDVFECLGDVEVVTIDDDGAVNIARAAKAIVTTTTRPATQPVAKATGAAPEKTARKDLDVLGSRVMKTVRLEGNARTESTLMDARGDLLRMFYAVAEVMEFHQPAEGKRRLVVPCEGKMMFVDNRPPEGRQAGKPVDDPRSGRGQTAFAWEKSLVYEQAESRMTMDGNVRVARADQAGEDRVLLQGDRLIADLVPVADPATRPARRQSNAAAAKAVSEARSMAATRPSVQPATRPADEGGLFDAQLSLRRVRMEGNIRVVHKTLNFEGDSLEFDPVGHLLTVRGAGHRQARQLDDNGLVLARFDVMVFNVETEQVIDIRPLNITIRK